MADNTSKADLTKELHDVEREEKKLEGKVENLNRRVIMLAVVLIFVLGGGIAAAAYLSVSNKSVYIDKSDIEAPLVSLAPTQSGILKNLYVQEGETIAPNTVVAQVGNELIKSTAGGVVVSASKDIGKSIQSGTAVVTTIDPKELHAVGLLAEDKGLSDVHIGDKATFTVDAFAGKKYVGVVDEVSPSSHNSDVVFSISDKRETKEFDVKVYFDTNTYPELKNGMSARIWVYKQ